MKWSWPGEMQ